MASVHSFSSAVEPVGGSASVAMASSTTNVSDGGGGYDTPTISHHASPHHPSHQQATSASGPTPPQQAQHPSRSVKRPRPVKSCFECRKRKLRCDRLCPCSQCQKSNRPCKYTPDHESSNLSDGSDAETSEPARPTKRNYPPSSTTTQGVTSGDPGLIPIPLKNGDTPGLPLLEELSIRMERLEKHVHVRSPAGTEYSGSRIVAAPAETIRGLTVKQGAVRTRYFGQNSPRVLMNLFDEAKAYTAQNARGNLFQSFQNLHNHLQKAYDTSLSPITVFVDSMMPVQKRMTDILPKKPVCDRLVASYIDTSETIYRILHLPTFAEQYNLYWEGKLQSESFLPQLLSVLSLASRFETKSKGLGHERVEGVHIPTACALVRVWLDSLKGKQLVELTTLQVELLLIHAQRMVVPRAQDSWTQLGFIVRLAMTMGLHRDPSEFEPRIPVFLGEIRRRLWFTLLDLDLHMSLASNLPCLVRDGDYTCRPPRNLDDSELFSGMLELPPSRPVDQLTDNQMQVYAAMTLGARMRVSHMVNRIDTIRDYQEVLEAGSKLDRFLDDINYIFPRHGVLSDAQRSKMWRSRVILDMHVRRPLLALYRPFAMGAPEAPPQISRAYLRSSMVILKYLDELDPMLAHFQDISAMYHQMLKRDIVQAALSVCYFIKPAVRPSADPLALGQQGLRMSPDISDDYPSYTPDNLMLWSPGRLVNTVQKTLDLLIRHMSGSDTKDILCLSIALESVRKPEPQDEDITHCLYNLLDACLRASNVTMEELHAQSLASMDLHRSDSYLHGKMQYSQSRYNACNPSDAAAFGGWMIWDGWE